MLKLLKNINKKIFINFYNYLKNILKELLKYIMSQQHYLSVFEKENLKAIENITNHHKGEGLKLCKEALDISFYIEDSNDLIHIDKEKSKKDLHIHIGDMIYEYLQRETDMSRAKRLNIAICVLVLFKVNGWKEKYGFNFNIESKSLGNNMYLMQFGSEDETYLYNKKTKKLLQIKEIRRIFK